MTDKPFIWHNVRTDNYANQLIEYLAACKIIDNAPNARLSNFRLPQFGIDFPSLDSIEPSSSTFVSSSPFYFDFKAISDALKAPSCQKVDSYCYAQRMEYMPQLDICKRTLPRLPVRGHTFGANDIVCPIRGSEVLGCVHDDYVQLPIGFYSEIFSKSNFDPVFMGQLDANPYCDELRRRFKQAWFLPSLGADADFESIRSAKQVVLPVSTFAWLAAWLSEALEITMPLIGLYNRLQCPHHDLMPAWDKRYTYYQFPAFKATPLNSLLPSLQTIEGSWRRV